jgi:hypothetical protein
LFVSLIFVKKVIEIGFVQSIVTGPFVLFKQLASAIDLSGTFTVFIVDFAEDFTFLV